MQLVKTPTSADENPQPIERIEQIEPHKPPKPPTFSPLHNVEYSLL